MPAGGGPPMLHRHDPFELYRVENGELAFYVEDDDGAVKRSVGGPGTVVSIPGGREHTIRNESEEDARAFVVFSPGAPMERFVRAAGALGEPDVQAVLELAATHGIEMTGPVEGARDGLPDHHSNLGRSRPVAGGYRQSSDTMSEVGRDHGLILHSAARTDEGLVIVNLWPRRTARRPRLATHAEARWSAARG